MKKVLVLGSGGLRIGQAGEFDYSGSQAIKALKEEGIRTVLVNPNIATIQTDTGLADEIYLQPLNVASVSKIIEKERPEAILLGFGGQTALNLGLELDRLGVLQAFGVAVLGTSIEAIRKTEDRELFKRELAQIGVNTPRSISATNMAEAKAAAEKIGYPFMMRSGFSLGGLGSGCIRSVEELEVRISEALSGAPQVLIEEYLLGWKEFEYEIVRDLKDQALAICNMENFDPMGVHTGESIVVAPSQTLNNREAQCLRGVALRVARHFQIQGECNVQFALNPKTGEYRVIEMNARLSRSSALASKATGYPLAFVAAKLALGYTLDQLKNAVTQTTTAFFEPALDYVVVKIPRWDFQKLKIIDRSIGTEMKSVGEVMAIGRSFSEALQKGIRMLNLGCMGIEDALEPIVDLEAEIRRPTDRRLFALYQFFQRGGTRQEAAHLSQIDPWFLSHIETLAQFAARCAQEPLTRENLLRAKQLGLADRSIGRMHHMSEDEIRARRLEEGIRPYVKEIDTVAGEFAAATSYLYMTYLATESDVAPLRARPVGVIGSGPYCIGSSVEFDWCAVNTARTLRKRRVKTILVNSNPETVSTDFDESDRLYFEELTLERIQDIADVEKPRGWIVSVGGQIANNLAVPLAQRGYSLFGTSAQNIDRAENRDAFSSLLERLAIAQPPWQRVDTLERAQQFAEREGYPVLIRPSYVLSGAAMNVVGNSLELERYVREATRVSPDFPIVISKFIENAKELEIDGVAREGTIIIQAIAEHVENAGIHSGDATLVLPPQRLYLETIRQAKKITQEIVRALAITGPFNLQFLAKGNVLQVIECNVRASRSFPFVSKATGCNLIAVATEIFLGIAPKHSFETLELSAVAVKMPQFSYQRLKGANPVAHVEMASTGEVAVLGEHLLETFFASWLATEQAILGRRLLISVSSDFRPKLFPLLQRLEALGWDLYATEGTSDFLAARGVGSIAVYKIGEKYEPNVTTLISHKKVDLIINIPKVNWGKEEEEFTLRRLAIDYHVPLVTNLQLSQLLLQCLVELNVHDLPVRSYREVVRGTPV